MPGKFKLIQLNSRGPVTLAWLLAPPSLFSRDAALKPQTHTHAHDKVSCGGTGHERPSGQAGADQAVENATRQLAQKYRTDPIKVWLSV